MIVPIRIAIKLIRILDKAFAVLVVSRTIDVRILIDGCRPIRDRSLICCEYALQIGQLIAR